MPRIVAAAFSLALAASASAQADSAKAYKNIHTIAIVSLLGNEVDMQTLGPIWTIKAYKLQTNWNFNEKITNEIGRLLASRFTIAAPPDPHLFGPVGNGLFEFPLREIHRSIAALPKNPGVDAYVVVFPFPGNSPTDWLGPFVRRDAGLFGEGTTIVGIYYAVGVFDASTGEEIDHGMPKIPAKGFLGGFSTPSANCSKTMWSDTAEGLSDDQKSRIARAMSSLATRSVAYALAGANLITESEAEASVKSYSGEDDPSCHPS
jgi:hypothetical protein